MLQSDSEESQNEDDNDDDDDEYDDELQKLTHRPLVVMPKLKLFLSSKDDSQSVAPPSVVAEEPQSLKINLHVLKSLKHDGGEEINEEPDVDTLDAVDVSEAKESSNDEQIMEVDHPSTIEIYPKLKSPGESTENDSIQVQDVDFENSSMPAERLILKIESSKSVVRADRVNSDIHVVPERTNIDESVITRNSSILVASGRTLWAAVMMREPGAQKMLRMFLARRLDKLISAEDKLPYEDSIFTSAYNLLQLSLDLHFEADEKMIVTVELPELDVLFIRRILPLVLFHFLPSQDSKQRQKKSFFENLISSQLLATSVPTTPKISTIESRASLLAEVLASWSSLRFR